MLIRFFAVFVAFFLVTVTANAAPGQSRVSSKKAKATGLKMKEPQFIEINDQILSVRTSFGGVYDSQPVWGGQYEYMMTKNFGLGGQVGYSRYTGATTSFGGYYARYEYQVFTAAVLGSLHADVLNVPNLDTFVTLGLGHAFVRSTVSTNFPTRYGSPDISADGDTTFVQGNLSARYFFSPQWGATGSLGFGHGNLAVGMDYVF